MEYLDIYDEEGNFLGKEDRRVVHQKGLWHKTVHCWLYDTAGNIYFQIRKDKGKMYTTASGHVKAGETVKEAFGREVKEEIGYAIDYEKAQLVEVVNFKMDRPESDGSIFKDRAFANVYACLFMGNLTELNFQEEEISGMVKISAEATLNLLKNESGTIECEESYKENGQVLVRPKTVKFSDFLVNPEEIALQKYGNVLEFVIQAIKK